MKEKMMSKSLIFCLICTLLLALPARAETSYVQEADFAAALQQEYAEQAGDEDIDFEFFGGQTNFAFDDAQNIKIMISNAKFDQQQNKFSTEAEVFGDGKFLAKTSLQGKFYILGEAYVPNRNINKGEEIRAEDLKKISLRINRLKPQNLTEAEKMVGKEAKRSLREGKIVNDKDVGEKQIIKKGDIVRLIYKTDKMLISANAEAMEDGCRGQKIEVRNTKSKKIVYGEAVDADTVIVNVQ